MIYCLNCGKGIPDASKFCTFCGTALKMADTNQPNDEIAPNSLKKESLPQPEYIAPVTQPSAMHEPVNQQNTSNTPHSHEPYKATVSAPAQPFVNAAYAAPQMQQTIQTGNLSKNEFYKNVGFWGAVLTLIGFFLPYVSTTEASFYYLVSDLAPDNPALYMYLIFPVCAAIIILQGLTGALPKILITIFKVLPILLLILFAIGISQKSSSFGFMGNDVETIMSNIGIGLYMIVIGSILMLFFKTTKIR